MRTDSVQTVQPVYVEGEAPGRTRLANFPVTFFAVVMGLGGLTLAWQRAAAVLDAPELIGKALFWITAVVYLAILVAYLAKLARHPGAVRAELHHPVRLAFMPTSAIALLLLATAADPYLPHVAGALWWAGVLTQLPMTLYVLSAWISRPAFGLQHITPAWFIPVVGNLVVPLAGAEHGPAELSWFFFSFGLVFWAALLPLVLTRLFIHEQPIPPQLLPTLAVLLAPPAVAFLDYLRMEPDGFGTFARVLYYTALFFGLLVLAQFATLRRVPFFLSWWAYSFPLAALTAATVVMAAALGKPAALVALSWVLLAGLSLLLVTLAVRTAAAMAGGRICVPE
jgi:tellurite resistance protein